MTKRRVMQSPTGSLPDFIAALFRDGTDCVLLRAHPYWPCLRHWWAIWESRAPRRAAARGIEWIDTPPPAGIDGVPYAVALADALAAVERGERYAAKRRGR